MAAPRISPPYIAIEPWIWNDPRVRGLGREARSLFGLLLTCPQQTKVPGLLLGAGVGALSDEWQSTDQEFRDAFAGLERAGLCVADWQNRVVYVVPLLEMSCNKPNGIPQAAAWGTVVFTMAPDCELVRRVDHDLRQLFLDSKALMASYLSGRPMSNEDAERFGARPLRSPPRQLGLQLPDPPAQPVAAEPAAPAPEPAGAEMDAELTAGVQDLVARAGAALGLVDGTFGPLQSEQLRAGWSKAYGTGWRRQDLGDLGSWVAQHNWAGLKMPVASYVAKYLGDCLLLMDKERPRSRPAGPSAASRGGPAHRDRLRWSLDSYGRPVSVFTATDQVNAVLDDAADLAIMQRLYEAHRRNEDITIATIRAALYAPRPADHDERLRAAS